MGIKTAAASPEGPCKRSRQRRGQEIVSVLLTRDQIDMTTYLLIGRPRHERCASVLLRVVGLLLLHPVGLGLAVAIARLVGILRCVALRDNAGLLRVSVIGLLRLVALVRLSVRLVRPVGRCIRSHCLGVLRVRARCGPCSSVVTHRSFKDWRSSDEVR